MTAAEPRTLDDPLQLVEEVAEALRLPARTIRYLIRRGELPAVVFPSNHIRIERSAVIDFIEKCKR